MTQMNGILLIPWRVSDSFFFPCSLNIIKVKSSFIPFNDFNNAVEQQQNRLALTNYTILKYVASKAGSKKKKLEFFERQSSKIGFQ